tara:strand:+ start:30 stop:1499 length:1470 start_codon:yes stop_codon:yes gene_type:complete
MNEEKIYSLSLQAVFVFIGKFVQFIFQFLVPIILVRIFSETDYGLYKQILFICLFIAPLLRFHFSHSLYYFYPLTNSKDEQDSLLSQTFFQLLAISILFSIILFLFKSSLTGMQFFIQFNEYVFEIAILIFFAVSSSILENIFIVEKKSKLVVLFSSVDKFIRTFFLFSFLFLFMTIKGALLGLILHSSFRFIFLLYYLFKKYRISLSKINGQLLKKQWNYVYPMGIGMFIGSLGKHADKIFLLSFLTSEDFAIYSIGNLNIPFIAMVYGSIGSVILPQISKYSKMNEFSKATMLWKSMILKNSIITIPIVIFFLIQAENIFLILFTDKYLASANVFRILLLILIIQMLGHGYILRGFARTKTILYGKIFRTIISIFFGYFLVKNLGVIGAAVTYLISFSVNAIYQLEKTRKLSNSNWNNLLPWLDFLKITIITIPSIISIFFIDLLIKDSLLNLLISLISYFSLILIFMNLTGYLDKLGLSRINFKKI